MDNPIIKNLQTLLSEFISSLSTPEFYVTVLAIGIAVTLGWLMAVLIERYLQRRFEEHPPKKIDKEFLLKPLKLLFPVLCIIYLGIARPIIDQYGLPVWLEAAMSLAIAYLIARVILLVFNYKLIGYFIAVLVMAGAVLDISGFLKPTTDYLGSIAFEVGEFKISILTIIKAAIMLVLVFWLAGLLSRTLESYLRRSSRISFNTRELLVKFFKIFFYLAALLTALSFAGIDLTAFAVFGGAVGVGIGLGLQKLAANFISGITMLMEKSVQIGDLVEIGSDTGWIRQLNVRYMLMETFDGREVFIPNEEFSSSRVVSWTHSNYRARISFMVGVAYGSDPKQVIDILINAAKAHPKCLEDPAPGAFLQEFADNSLNFQLMFWVGDVREGRFAPQSDVMVTILEEFSKAGIEIPFPQRVLHIPQKIQLESSDNEGNP